MKNSNISTTSFMLTYMLGKKLTFQLSHYLGTINSNRARWSNIKAATDTTGAVYLGSMLFAEGAGPYLKHTKHAFLQSVGTEHNKKINVVQVVEQHEVDNNVNPNFLKLTKNSRALTANDSKFNIIGPIQWADFGYAIPDLTALQNQLDVLCEAHNKGEIIYFHCKAGVNRSFRMSALFSLYHQLKQKDNLNELELDDLIMQTCSDIWDARPCVCFERDEWLAQFNSLKQALKVMQPNKIAVSSADYQTKNNLRLDLQYELYRYRHHLKQTVHKYKKDVGNTTKINKVNELIDATQYTATSANNLEKIHNSFSQKMQQSDSIQVIKQARNSGFSRLFRSIIKFIFRIPKTKGA